VPEVDMGKNSFMMPKIRRAFEHALQLLTAAITSDRVESYLAFLVRPDDPALCNRPAFGISLNSARHSATAAEDDEDSDGDGDSTVDGAAGQEEASRRLGATQVKAKVKTIAASTDRKRKPSIRDEVVAIDGDGDEAADVDIDDKEVLARREDRPPTSKSEVVDLSANSSEKTRKRSRKST
jgi:hypothetical protein